MNDWPEEYCASFIQKLFQVYSQKQLRHTVLKAHVIYKRPAYLKDYIQS